MCFTFMIVMVDYAIQNYLHFIAVLWHNIMKTDDMSIFPKCTVSQNVIVHSKIFYSLAVLASYDAHNMY